MSLIIDINQQSDLWDDTCSVEAPIRAVLQYLDIDEAEVSVVLADNAFVQELNRKYRGKDKPTNVLSFPQDAPLLGDVILAFETIEEEAKAQGKTFNDHVTHLLVHGCLHLLGYDHENDKDAKEMEGLEIKILETLGIQNPYESKDL